MLITRRRMLLAAGLAALLPACSREQLLTDIHGTDLYKTGIGSELALQGADGKPYTLDSFKGKAVLVFFGFTQCPDVCPTALFRATEIRRELGKDGDRLQVVFITVDSERDTPQMLRDYTQAFDPTFIGLHGTPEQTAKTAAAFKVYYRKVPTGSSYTMDHTAMSYVYDAKGQLRLGLSHVLPLEEYVSDIRKVLALG